MKSSSHEMSMRTLSLSALAWASPLRCLSEGWLPQYVHPRMNSSTYDAPVSVLMGKISMTVGLDMTLHSLGRR